MTTVKVKVGVVLLAGGAGVVKRFVLDTEVLCRYSPLLQLLEVPLYLFSRHVAIAPVKANIFIDHLLWSG